MISLGNSCANLWRGCSASIVRYLLDLIKDVKYFQIHRHFQGAHLKTHHNNMLAEKIYHVCPLLPSPSPALAPLPLGQRYFTLLSCATWLSAFTPCYHFNQNCSQSIQVQFLLVVRSNLHSTTGHHYPFHPNLWINPSRTPLLRFLHLLCHPMHCWYST